MASLGLANRRVVLDKLAKCQQILGYTFRDISLLEKALTLGENRRLASAGDTYVQVALVDRWYSLAERTSNDLSTVKIETLSNSNLAKVGFRKGLDACTLPMQCYQNSNMADTVEAVLGAVYRDALFKDGQRKAINWDEFERVVARLGINHQLIASASDLRWALTPMRTTRKILPQFFSKGNHFALAKMLAGMSGNLHAPSSANVNANPDAPAPLVEEPHHEEEVETAVNDDPDSRLRPHDIQYEEEADDSTAQEIELNNSKSTQSGQKKKKKSRSQSKKKSRKSARRKAKKRSRQR